MRVPDSHVRPAGAAEAPGAAGARRSLLARLLLRFFEHLSQLDRKLLLLFVAAPLSACVIPVGPQFQDPAGDPDQAPFFTSTNPAMNSEVMSPLFEITATDPNPGDSLHVRWIADFPETVPDMARTLSLSETFAPGPNNTPARAHSTITVDCDAYKLQTGVDRHRIAAVVADQDFAGGTDLTAVSNQGRSVLATWVWNVTCPPR